MESNKHSVSPGILFTRDPNSATAHMPARKRNHHKTSPPPPPASPIPPLPPLPPLLPIEQLTMTSPFPPPALNSTNFRLRNGKSLRVKKRKTLHQRATTLLETERRENDYPWIKKLLTTVPRILWSDDTVKVCLVGASLDNAENARTWVLPLRNPLGEVIDQLCEAEREGEGQFGCVAEVEGCAFGFWAYTGDFDDIDRKPLHPRLLCDRQKIELSNLGQVKDTCIFTDFASADRCGKEFRREVEPGIRENRAKREVQEQMMNEMEARARQAGVKIDWEQGKAATV